MRFQTIVHLNPKLIHSPTSTQKEKPDINEMPGFLVACLFL
ncbi:hypothetical protein [Hymenobacter tibetensis]|nr:hypothetical protein [Hymenobacter tibetensis]